MTTKKQSKDEYNNEYLSQKGLNIHAIINLKEIPEKILKDIANSGINTHNYNQLIVIGHLGKGLWESVCSEIPESDNPIDGFVIQSVKEYFNKDHNSKRYEIIYPGEAVFDLQQLGEIAGWHYRSPFMLGINQIWGSWFAYRAIILSNTNFTETPALKTSSPCGGCVDKYCIAACPALALENLELNLQRCINYRKQDDSRCKTTCLARVSCPVGGEFRYCREQINYHYSVSMKAIDMFY